ncbi:hypothetical protein EHV15_34930 [Paenibacillus oralis]|uniref:Uncharacterized protein n=1 Tax=Paenibacillus oralis TaxID=2490856 RepID=A0A3P3TCH1_9BACL|nr:hypothetical protein [Paenibacillus oralis]RRJ54788.1 hypothetical protein EHV15_34930 [Paenibacillus oralis]
MQMMTFQEFLDRWIPGSPLIGPKDYETRDRNELGVIDGGNWSPITFSPVVENLIGEYIRSQLLEYCDNLPDHIDGRTATTVD